MHEILKLDIVAFRYRLSVPCDPLELVKIATANLSFVIVLLHSMRTVSQLTFSEYRFRTFWSVQSAIEKFSRESVVVEKVFVHRELICIFFSFIHSNAPESFFEVKFSWSVGDTWPKVKVRFPRDLHLPVCVFFHSFRPDYRQKNAL